MPTDPIVHHLRYQSPYGGESLRMRDMRLALERVDAFVKRCTTARSFASVSLRLVHGGPDYPDDIARLAKLAKRAAARFSDEHDDRTSTEVTFHTRAGDRGTGARGAKMIEFMLDQQDEVDEWTRAPFACHVFYLFDLALPDGIDAGTLRPSPIRSTISLSLGSPNRWSLNLWFPCSTPDKGFRAIDRRITAVLGRPLPERGFRVVGLRGGEHVTTRKVDLARARRGR